MLKSKNISEKQDNFLKSKVEVANFLSENEGKDLFPAKNAEMKAFYEKMKPFQKVPVK